MNVFVAVAALGGSAALLALFLARGRIAGRLYLDALAIGLTLGATVAMVFAPFDLRTNPLHFSAATVALLFAGLPEEGAKLLGVFAFLRAHYLARGRRDVVFAAGALSLGFAALEDVFYLTHAGAGWTRLAEVRAATAVPFHVLLGLAGGYGIASLKPGWRGGALALAVWAGLAAIHGVYDFAVFASLNPPAGLRAFAASHGLDLGFGLRALLALAEIAAALAGGLAALAVWGAGEAPAARGFSRIVQSRALAWIVGAILSGAAVLALAGAAFTSVALESADIFLETALTAVLPLAFGLLFLAMRARRRAPVSPRVKRLLLAGGGLAVLALACAAWVWGAETWRTLDALRFEARGAHMAARGDYAQAVEAYSRALAAAPGRIEALSLRAGALARLNRFDAALADLDAALRAAPQLAPLYVQRADIDRQRNAPAAAAADLDAALKRLPGNPEILGLRAQARLEAGDAKGADADLAEAARRAPNDPLILRVRAAWEVSGGDLDGALRELNAALHINANDADAAFQRGRVWFYRGDLSRARADLRSADVKPSFLYPALWRHLAGADAADLRKRLNIAPAAWPAPVARLLLGDISFEAARAAASDDDERCEADFYFAMSRLRQDDADASAARLHAALKECPTSFIEYEGAKAELRRMAR